MTTSGVSIPAKAPLVSRSTVLTAAALLTALGLGAFAVRDPGGEPDRAATWRHAGAEIAARRAPAAGASRAVTRPRAPRSAVARPAADDRLVLRP